MKLILALGILAALAIASVKAKNRTFEVDYEHDTFLMDGKNFSYASGSVHYFRIPHQYWQDRLRKVRLLGFNVISTYIEWSLHEPQPGVYNFEGDADIVQFLQLAQEEGLHVIFRAGPYICGEREFGGFPAWLLTKKPNMKMRTSDPTFLHYVEKWYEEMYKRISPMLYGNGGPIITLQIENEYGSYPLNDRKYLYWLRNVTESYVKGNAVLITTDNMNSYALHRARIPGVFTTVDFGATLHTMDYMFGPLRKVQPHGPLVNSEFYTGWLSYWGHNVVRVDTWMITHAMKLMLDAKVNFNVYMVSGGTNFGFTSGYDANNPYVAYDLTTYDYDSPISEAGDLTDKYMAMRDLMKQYGWAVGSDEEVAKLRAAPKGNYGTVLLKPVVSLLKSSIGSAPTSTKYPLNMEAYNQSYGVIAYTHKIQSELKHYPALQFKARDRTHVFVDDDRINIVENEKNRMGKAHLYKVRGQGSKLTLVVENNGRTNSGSLADVTKGIVSNVTLNGTILSEWEAVSYSLTTNDIETIETLPTKDNVEYPAFFTSTFTVPNNSMEYPYDTFLNMTGWSKGIAFVNGHNLGRYWTIGPQMTLYVPGVWLKPGSDANRLTILELDLASKDQSVSFIDEPVYLVFPSE